MLETSPIFQTFQRARSIRLLRPQRYLACKGEIRRISKGIGANQVVLARSACRFVSLPLIKSTKSKQLQALRLQLKQWSPWDNPAYFIAPRNEHAMVWLWDATQLSEQQSTANLKPETHNVIPESLFFKPEQESGAYLLKLADGIEGQIWANNALIASRWWPNLPDTSMWQAFVRSASVNVDVGQPSSLQQPDYNIEPWANNALTGSLQSKLESLIYVTLFSALACASLWFSVTLDKIKRQTETLTAEVKRIQQQATPLLDAKRNAQETTERIQQTLLLTPYPTQLELMAALAKALPNEEISLREWDFRDGRLKISLASKPDKVSGIDLIKAFEHTGIYSDAKLLAGSTPQNLVMVMTVKPRYHAEENKGE